MFHCVLCNYTTQRSNDYRRHLESKKHLKIKNSVDIYADYVPKISQVKNEKSSVMKKFTCEFCGTEYRHHSSLCKHRHKCAEKLNLEQENANLIRVGGTKDIEIKEKNKLIEEYKNKLDSYHLKLENEKDSHKNSIKKSQIINIVNNTQKITNNFKDAPNISFPTQIKGQLKNYIDLGAPKGVTNFILDHYCMDIPPDKRSIWCADLSRNKFLIRVDNKWVVDVGGNKFREATQSEMIYLFKEYIKENITKYASLENCDNKNKAMEKMMKDTEFLNSILISSDYYKALKDAAKKGMIY